jgi:hypothetical protein
MTSYNLEELNIEFKEIRKDIKVNIYLYALLFIMSFIWTSKYIYLIYIIIFVYWLNNDGSLQDSIYKCNVTKFIYKNNVVSNVNLINYINLLVIYTYVIPFTYVGLSVGYIFATLFLDFTLLNFFHKKYLHNNRLNIKIYVNDNKLDKIEGLPDEMKYKYININNSSKKMVKEDNCLYIMGDESLENIHVSHNNLFNIEVIKNNV